MSHVEFVPFFINKTALKTSVRMHFSSAVSIVIFIIIIIFIIILINDQLENVECQGNLIMASNMIQLMCNLKSYKGKKGKGRAREREKEREREREREREKERERGIEIKGKRVKQERFKLMNSVHRMRFQLHH